MDRGTRLGHYEVIGSLGAGGMGEVYRARDTKLDREVAIKILPEELAQDKERLDRFEREARLLARLNHPNVATLHGLEEAAGQKFIVMELVEGETLAERIAKGAIPLDEATRLFTQIAESLEAAHGKGIVHRDLKPANVKIAPGGKIKILDFGLAKAYVKERAPSNLTESPTITKGTATGVILGTVPYMSPEQARGKPVDKRIDVWAFGCCLFEALTTQVAFLGETVTDTLVTIVEREPRWEALPEGTPPSIHRLLRRCLQKDPDRRLRDIGDARIELDELHALPTRATSPARSRRVLWLTALVGTAVLAVLLGNLRPRPPQASDAPAQLIVSLAPAQDLAYGQSELGIQAAGGFPVVVSPGGTHLAYVGVREDLDRSRLYIRDLADAEGREVPDSAGASHPFFSPDGQWVGFFAGGFLKKISVSGGTPIDICEANSPRGGSWSDQDQIVFAPISRTTLSLVSPNGGTPEPVTVLDTEHGETSHRIPAFLPGGDAFLFLAEGSTRRDTRVVAHSLSTGKRRVLVEDATLPRYSPTGHLLYVQGGTSMAAPFDVEQLELLRTGIPILPVEATLFGVSETGSLVYLADEVTEGITHLAWVNPSGDEELLAAPPRGYRHPRLSPDESRIAVDIVQGGDRNIWMYDIGRATLTRLTFDRSNLWPIWTPDGSRITYASNQADTVWDLHWRREDGSSADEVLWTARLPQFPRSWSPDGRTLAFSHTDPTSRSDIWLLSLDGSTAEPWLATGAMEIMPAISPDGNWIAYASNESGPYEVYVRPLSGPGKWQISTGGGAEPLWSRNGTELFYRSGKKMYGARVSAGDTFSFETPAELFEGTYFSSLTGHAAYDVAKDGRVLMVKPEPRSPTGHVNIVLNWFQELERLLPTEN